MNQQQTQEPAQPVQDSKLAPQTQEPAQNKRASWMEMLDPYGITPLELYAG